jgi:hypothetical protein
MPFVLMELKECAQLEENLRIEFGLTMYATESLLIN